MPEVCVATIDTLPATGSDTSGLLPIALTAAGVLIVGIALLVSLVSARRLRRGRAGLGVGIAVVLAALVAGGVSTPAPAHAASGPVTYGDGCTLIAVSDVEVPAAGGVRLVPGETARIVTAVVSNPTGEPLELALRGDIGAPLAALLDIVTAVDGAAAESVVVPGGGTVTVSLTVTLPVTASDAAQGLDARAALVVTATQR